MEPGRNSRWSRPVSPGRGAAGQAAAGLTGALWQVRGGTGERGTGGEEEEEEAGSEEGVGERDGGGVADVKQGRPG